MLSDAYLYRLSMNMDRLLQRPAIEKAMAELSAAYATAPEPQQALIRQLLDILKVRHAEAAA